MPSASAGLELALGGEVVEALVERAGDHVVVEVEGLAVVQRREVVQGRQLQPAAPDRLLVLGERHSAARHHRGQGQARQHRSEHLAHDAPPRSSSESSLGWGHAAGKVPERARCRSQHDAGVGRAQPYHRPRGGESGDGHARRGGASRGDHPRACRPTPFGRAHLRHRVRALHGRAGRSGRHPLRVARLPAQRHPRATSTRWSSASSAESPSPPPGPRSCPVTARPGRRADCPPAASRWPAAAPALLGQLGLDARGPATRRASSPSATTSTSRASTRSPRSGRASAGRRPTCRWPSSTTPS